VGQGQLVVVEDNILVGIEKDVGIAGQQAMPVWKAKEAVTDDNDSAVWHAGGADEGNGGLGPADNGGCDEGDHAGFVDETVHGD